MHEYAFLQDLLAIFGLGLAAVVFFHRVHLPAVLAFLVTGILCGPYGLALVDDVPVIEMLAEIGIVLLLFTLGIEFSVPHFMRMRRFLLLGGALQVGLTVLAAVGMARYIGLALPLAIFIGMLLSISSTALVLRLLDSRGELDAAHGRNALTILIFQDLCIVPMVLLTPFLGGKEVDSTELLQLGGKTLLLGAASIIVVKYLLPWMMHQVTQTRKREAFILAIVFICLGTAWATSHAGLSMALGAFAAGLVLSESRYSHQALGEIVPFREVFNCLVFVSIGMLFDVRTLFEMPVEIAVCVAIVIVGKSAIAAGVTRAFGHSLRVAVLTGLALGQTSEFSFVLGKVGLAAGVIDPATNQLFLSVAILTMMLSPAVTAFGPRLVAGLAMVLPVSISGVRPKGELGEDERLDNHAIIVGFEHKGKQVAKALETARIPYIVIHDDPHVVRDETLKGRNIVYGDATTETIFEYAGIRSARLVAVTMSDSTTSRQAADMVKRLNPSVFVIASAHGLIDTSALLKVGADEVVSSRVVASIDFVRRVLERFQVPGHLTDSYVVDAQAEYASLSGRLIERFRPHNPVHSVPFSLLASSIKIEEGSEIAGKTITESGVNRKTGASIVAIQRSKGEPVKCPGGDEVLGVGDDVMLLGRSDQVAEAALLFREPKIARESDTPLTESVRE